MSWLVLILTAGLAAAQERVQVEAEPHEGFGRLIVTFPDRMNLPEHTVTNENGVLVISMDDTTMEGTLPDLGAILGDYLAVARFDPDRTTIRIGLRGPFRLNTIAAAEQLYIDLLPPDWVGLPPSLPDDIVDKLARRAEDAARIAEERRRAEMVAEYDPTASIRVGNHPTFSRIIFGWSVGTKAEFSQDGLTATLEFDWPVPVDLYPLLSNLPPQIATVENEVDPGGSALIFTLAEEVALRFYENSPDEFILDVEDPGADGGPVDPASLVAEAREIVPEAAVPPESEEEDAEPTDRPTEIVPRASAIGSTVRIVFPFPDETPAAVFQRGDRIWMIFDSSLPVTQPAPGSDEVLDGLVSDFSVQSAGAAQIVHMDLDQNGLATLGSEGRAWVLSLGQTLLSGSEPITLERSADSAGYDEIVAQLPQPSKVHQLRDPEVGDVLEVVTLHPPARGIVRQLEYVDFTALRSVHGLVIRPHHDEVAVRVEDESAVISAATGLVLSDAATIQFRLPAGGSETMMALAPLYAPNSARFAERLDELSERTATLDGRELEVARLNLAQFYLANGYAHEAIGVLDVLRDDMSQSSLETKVNTAWAAASALAGRAGDALSVLDAEPVRNEADAMLWRAIVRAENTTDYAAARLDAIGAQDMAGDYPGWIHARFQLAAIRAALMQRDLEMAGEMINAVDLSVLSRDQVAQYELFAGMLDQFNGRNAEALESYGRVIAADRRPTNAEAILRTVELLDDMGRLDIERGIGTLAVQAAIWRGGPLELDINAKLTDLMFRNGDYRDGFVLARDMAANNEDSPALDAIVTQARREFASLYLDGRADALAPIEALSLYYDYRQLTPPGSDGDLMIRNLASRLIEVDLLAQASELLQYQVDNRLEGAARAEVAADLAVVYLAGHDPNSALRVLNQTRLAGLPPGLDRQRRVLEAGALINAGRQDLALDLLSSLNGRDAELLRIDALWQAKRYRDASERIEVLYADQADEGALTPMARTNVLKAAVGYVFTNDAIGIARLRSRFSEAMSNAPEWPMFALVTENVDSSGSDFREIARKVADTNSINAFLNAYRDIYADDDTLIPDRATPNTVASL